MRYFVRSDGTTLPLSPELDALLRGIAAGRTLEEIVAAETGRPGADPHEIEIAAAVLFALGLARDAAPAEQHAFAP